MVLKVCGIYKVPLCENFLWASSTARIKVAYSVLETVCLPVSSYYRQANSKCELSEQKNKTKKSYVPEGVLVEQVQ
jgi:hypothetical protein